MAILVYEEVIGQEKIKVQEKSPKRDPRLDGDLSLGGGLRPGRDQSTGGGLRLEGYQNFRRGPRTGLIKIKVSEETQGYVEIKTQEAAHVLGGICLEKGPRLGRDLSLGKRLKALLRYKSRKRPNAKSLPRKGS